VQYAQQPVQYVQQEPGGAVTYAAPQYSYVQQDAAQQVTYAAPQTLAYPATTAYASPQVVNYGGEAGVPGQVTYAAPQTLYAEPQPVTYYVQGGDAAQHYLTSMEPQMFHQQPAMVPGAEENPVAGAQTFAMPQAFQAAPQPSGMQSVQSMVMPMPNYPANQPMTENAPQITPTPPPAAQTPEPSQGPAASAKKSSKKTSSKKSGKTSKKKKSGCC